MTDYDSYDGHSNRDQHGNRDPHLTNEQWHYYDDAYIRKIAKEGAKEGANEVLEAMVQRFGLDPQDWKETQKDTAYLRKLRKNSDQLSMWVARGVIGIVLSALAGAVWIAIKASK